MAKQNNDKKDKRDELLLETQTVERKELSLTSSMDIEKLENSNEDEPDQLEELVLDQKLDQIIEEKKEQIKTEKIQKSNKKSKNNIPEKKPKQKKQVSKKRQYQFIDDDEERIKESSSHDKTATHTTLSNKISEPENLTEENTKFVSNPNEENDASNEEEASAQEQISGINPKELLNALNRSQNSGGPDNTDISFMPPTSAAYLKKPATSTSKLLYTILAFFIILFIWAYFSEIDEYTRGQGRVIPSGQVKVVDHLEGGIVKDILVREGEIVEQGQILLRIDSTVAKSKYDEGIDLYYRTMADVERLRAQLNNTKYVVPEIIQKEAPDIATYSLETYEAEKTQLENEKNIAEQEVLQRKQELVEVESKVDELQKGLELTQEEVKLTEPLVKNGVSPKIDWLRLQKDLVSIKGDLESAKVNVPKAKAALLQAQRKFDQVEFKYRTQYFKELNDAQKRWAEIKDMTTTGLDRLNRTDVKSPVKGIIKSLKVNTVGSAINQGQDLVEIVPLEDTLLIEAEVSPRDVAFLHPGMHAKIKITAYDFAIYGGLDATLTEISADSIIKQDQKDKEYFRVRLRTDKNHLGTDDNPLPISPGMTAQVDILTGKKTILQYILKPILKAKQNALTER